MEEIDSILSENQHAHLVLQKVRDRIVNAKFAHHEPTESWLLRLAEGEKVVMLVNGFIWETTNGGFSQFLTNSAGDYAEELRRVLKTIGATHAADALDETSSLIFSGGPIPTDRQSRCERLFAWEKSDDVKAIAFFSKWSHTLGWCESVEEAIANYIRAHKEMFA